MRRYFKFFLAQTTALNEKKILDKLSPILRAEVVVHSEPLPPSSFLGSNRSTNPPLDGSS